MGLLLIALAGILLGGLVSFRRQGKPIGVQVFLGVCVVLLLLWSVQMEPFR